MKAKSKAKPQGQAEATDPAELTQTGELEKPELMKRKSKGELETEDTSPSSLIVDEAPHHLIRREKNADFVMDITKFRSEQILKNVYNTSRILVSPSAYTTKSSNQANIWSRNSAKQGSTHF